MWAAFADAEVRYLVIGGHAVSLHAHPRTTKDIDVWLDPERANVARACAALRSFGIPAPRSLPDGGPALGDAPRAPAPEGCYPPGRC